MEYSYFELSNIMNNIPSEDDSGTEFPGFLEDTDLLEDWI